MENENEENLKVQDELEKEKVFKEAMEKLNSEIDELKNKNNVLESENESLKKDSEQKMNDVKAANETSKKLKNIMGKINKYDTSIINKIFLYNILYFI